MSRIANSPVELPSGVEVTIKDSTISVKGGKGNFGPAARPLPQLNITVDEEGYLVAAAPFNEAVGPSFWGRLT